MSAIKTLSFKDVLHTTNQIGHIDHMLALAETLGYPYFLWNDRVYAAGLEYTDTGLTIADVGKTVWVLTCEHNDHDQYGEYFEAVFAEKPHHAQLSAHGVPTHRLKHVLDGGGRRDDEDKWFFLREITC